MHPTAALVCALAAPFSMGFMGSLATQPALEKGGWYRRIKKPKWTPPDFCFPLVWTLLYAAMGVASWRVWLNGGTAIQWTAYAAQLALNGAFSPLLFSMHRPWAAFVDTMLLLIATAACIVCFISVDTLAAWLLAPLLPWTLFAGALTARIAQLNKASE